MLGNPGFHWDSSCMVIMYNSGEFHHIKCTMPSFPFQQPCLPFARRTWGINCFHMFCQSLSRAFLRLFVMYTLKMTFSNIETNVSCTLTHTYSHTAANLPQWWLNVIEKLWEWNCCVESATEASKNRSEVLYAVQIHKTYSNRRLLNSGFFHFSHVISLCWER